MIEMANLSVIPKVSRVFARIYAYTARWKGSSKSFPFQTRGASAMKYFSAYLCGILILLAGNAAGQTRVYTIPEGRMFTVDGVAYTAATTHLWATGSKHILLFEGPVPARSIGVKSQKYTANFGYDG